MTRKSDTVVEIDLAQFVTAFVIVISTLIFSTSMFFSAREIGNGLRESGNGSGSAAVVDNRDDLGDTVADAPTVEANPSGTTSIDDDAYIGDLNSARVAIVEFTDFECPFCQRHFQETKSQIVSEFVDSGDVVYVQRDLPLSFHDPVATDLAIAAECVKLQNGNEGYFAMSDLIFTNTGTNGAGVGGRDVLAEYADEVGANVDDFLSCYDNRDTEAEVQADAADAAAAGVNGTPGFIIGILDGDTVEGVTVSGAQPFSVFQQAIEEQLAR